ncbi:MAG: DUF11 domain-containing protein [Deltaproteobacteria bacterium]|nr:DUF11 domain-containing protein [Deltaproteobacteria bacterium]
MLRHTSALASACLVVLAALPAQAAPQYDQNAGTYSDSFTDPAGIGADSVDIRRDGPGHYVTIDTGKSTGTLVTKEITPVSFSTWGRVYLDYTAASASDLEVRVRGASGTVYGPFAIVASDDANFDGMALVAGVPGGVPASELGAFLQVKMTRFVQVVGLPDETSGETNDVRIVPTLQAVRVTWTPQSVVRVSTEVPATACSAAQFTVKVKVAVSYVNAKSVVVAAPLPVAPLDATARAWPLSFVSATHGGTYTASATTIGGVPVLANSVYWQLGDVNAGNTFVVSFNVTSPVGTIAGTTYPTAAAAKAANSTLASYPPAATPANATVIQASAAPVVRKSAVNVFNIGGRDYIDGGATLGYSIWYANHEFPPPTCAAAMHRTVIWDDVSDLVEPVEGGATGSVFTGVLPSAFTIANNGVYTHDGDTIDGVVIPRRSIYWKLDTLEVGERGTVGYTLNLKPEGTAANQLPEEHRIDDVADMTSGLTQESAAPSPHSVWIGIPNAPSGIYAKGDRIRGSSSISASPLDNWWLSVGYGEPITFLLYARNGGASTLTDTVMVDMVPPGTTFTSLAVPPGVGATAWYYTGPPSLDPNAPPSLPIATGMPGTGWLPTPPSDPTLVTWVAVTVDRLASSYFPQPGVPVDVTAELTVTVNPPGAGCAQSVVENRGLFATYRYIEVGATEVLDIEPTSWFVNAEPVTVKPVVPSFEFAQLRATPTSVAASGPLTFTLDVRNQQSGGVETDTARDVVVQLTMPKTRINGVEQPLPFVSVTAPGGVANLAGLPDTLTVTYPTIAPGASPIIDVRVNVPKGYVSGSSVGMTATMTANDDLPVCSPVSAVKTASATLAGSPYLVVSKRTNLGVASPGSQVAYTLDYVNIGDTVSTGTWIVDRIPPGTSVVSGTVPGFGGQVWYSNTLPPSLPANLRAESPVFTDALVRAHFVRSTSVSGGQAFPSVSSPTWIAFLVDNGSLTPAQLEIGQSRSVQFTVSVQADIGSTLRNDAGVLSKEVLPAISNEVVTFVSDEPSLEVTRTCPAVVSAGEPFTYTIDYLNNSTNPDYDVAIEETLPAGVSGTGTHAFLPGLYPGLTVPVVKTGQVLRAEITEAINPAGTSALGSQQGGRVTVSATIPAGTPSGTRVELAGLAYATDFTRTLDKSAYSSCLVLVENADLFVRLGVDQPAPVSGETITYTAIVSNEGANDADGVTLVIQLPQNVTFVGGAPVIVTTPGWTIGSPVVTNGGRTITWSGAGALTMAGAAPGYFPGHSGDVAVAFQAVVAPTTPAATTLTATASVPPVPGEDPNFPNVATVDVRTPRPDPYVLKTGPSFAQPGQTVTYRLRYGNASRQATGAIVVIDKLWDAPVADGQVDVTYVGHTASPGEAVWFHGGTLSGAAPAFTATPSNGGWTQNPASLARVQWIAVTRQSLPGNAGPYSVYVDVALRAPVGNVTPLPGSTIRNLATVGPVGPGADGDDDPENNTSFVDTQTPGVDIALAADCTPSGAYPGVLPGGAADVVLTLSNNGTVTAYGLKVAYTPPAWFDVLGDDAGAVSVIGASGAAGALVDAAGQPFTTPVSWTKSAGTYVLGETGADTAPKHYRRVGLPAGAKVQIRVTGKVGIAIGNDTAVTQSATGVIDYRYDYVEGVSQKEEVTTNNGDTCGTTVYRADPIVRKTGQGFAATSPFTAGDQVQFTIAYNNVGGAAADGVVIEDYFPEGVPFVVGSFTDLPDGAVLEYDNGNGNFDYVIPEGAEPGTPEPNVRALRVRWTGPLPAPAGATFAQDTVGDFAAGTLDNTRVVSPGSVVVAGLFGDTGTYTSPVIPATLDGNVVSWERILVGSQLGPEGDLAIDVLDADTGEVIASALRPDDSGAIPLAVDPAQHRRIRLRAHLTGAALRCEYGVDDWGKVDSVTPFVPSLNSYMCNGEDTIIAWAYPAHDWFDFRPVAFAVAPDGTQTALDLPRDPNERFYTNHAFPGVDGLLFGTTYGYRDAASSVPAYWVETSTGWEYHRFSLPLGAMWTNVYSLDLVSRTAWGQSQLEDGTTPYYLWRFTPGSGYADPQPLPSLDGASSCSVQTAAHDNRFVTQCSSQTGLVYGYVDLDGDAWRHVPLPSVVGVSAMPYYVMSDGSVTGQGQDAIGVTRIYHWTRAAGVWSVEAIQVDADTALTEAGFHVGTTIWSRTWVDEIAHPVRLDFASGEWTSTILPVGGFSIDSVVDVASSGRVLVSCHVGDERPGLCVIDPDGGDYHDPVQLEDPASLDKGYQDWRVGFFGDDQTIVAQFSDELGTNQVAYFELSGAGPALTSTVRVTMPEPGTSSSVMGELGGSFRDARWRDRRADNCPGLVLQTPVLGPVDLDAEGDSLVAQPLDGGVRRAQSAVIQSESNGHYIGFSTRIEAREEKAAGSVDESRITLWKQDAAEVLAEYDLGPRDPQAKYTLGMISPDGKWVFASEGLSGRGSRLLLARYDATTDAYVRVPVDGATGPDYAGTVEPFGGSTDLNRAPILVKGTVVNAVGEEERGFWMWSPTDPRGMVWWSRIFPEAKEFTRRPYTEPFGNYDMAVVTIDGAYHTVVHDQSAPTGIRAAVLPLPEEVAVTPAGQSHITMAVNREGWIGGAAIFPGGEELTVHGVMWRRIGSEWQPIVVYNEPYFVPLAISDAHHGDTGLPLVAGYTMFGQGLAVLEPTGPESWAFADFDVPEGAESFSSFADPFGTLSSNWSVPPAERYTSGVAFGLVTGMAYDPIAGVNMPYIQAPNADGGWTAVPLPTGETFSFDVVGVGAGPVLYGYVYEEETTWLAAWDFEGGDRSKPRLHKLLDADEYKAGYSSPNTATAAGVMAVRIVQDDMERVAMLVPTDTGVEVRIPEIYAYDPGKVLTATSTPLIVSRSGQHVGYHMGCEPGGESRLDAWSVVFRTDLDPSFGYRVEVPDVCQASFDNTATISTTTPEITDANNASTATVAVATTDLAVTLTPSSGVVEQDDWIYYEVSVTNRGATAARDVVLELATPAGDGVSDPAITRWIVGTLLPGATYTQSGATYVSTSESFLSLVANASVTTSSIDCVDANDAASAVTLTGNLPNLAVDVSAPPSVEAGGTFGYTVTVANTGNVTSNGNTLTFTVPTGLVIGDLIWSGGYGDETEDVDCTRTGQVITCTVPFIDAYQDEGTPFVLTVDVTAPGCEAVGGDLMAVAVAAADLDVNLIDNSDSATTALEAPGGRIDVRVVPGRSTVEPGGDITWFVHWASFGAESAGEGRIVVDLPAGTVRYPGSGTVDAQAGTITFELPDAWPGRTGSTSFTMGAPAALGELTGVARVEADNLCAGDVPFGGAIVAAPGLTVAKATSGGTVCGGTLDWIVSVTNAGATTLPGLVVTDPLPAATPYVAGSIKGPGASAQSVPVLVWNIGDLAPGESVTLGYSTLAPASAGTLVTNVARVSSGAAVIGQSAPVAVRADCGQQLAISKAWDGACAQPGDRVTVTVDYQNLGDETIEVSVADHAGPHFTDIVAPGAIIAENRVAKIETLGPRARGRLTWTGTLTAPVGHVVLDSAIIFAANGRALASNQVSGVVVDCDDGNHCTLDVCVLFEGCRSTNVPRPEVDELCDGIDNDCDLAFDADDDDLVLEPCEKQDGVCRGSRHLASDCVDGDFVACSDDTYEAHSEGDYALTDPSCDGVDQDCSGANDDDYVGVQVSCGNPGCVGTAITFCVAGEVGDDCEPLADGTICDDMNACSDASSCAAGTCRATRYIACNDDNVCTSDSCAPAVGCVFDPVEDGQACDDEDACSTRDACVAGECAGGDWIVCAAPDECQYPGRCNPDTGVCDYEVMPGDVPVPIRLTDLGTLGGTTSKAHAVNADGAVVGESATAAGAVHAFWWDADGGMVDLTPGAGNTSVAFGVNDAGRVLGRISSGGTIQVFAWEDGVLSTLFPARAGLTNDELAFGPTPSGRIAGNGANGVAYHSGNGTSATVIAGPEGTKSMTVKALSDSGVVVGSLVTASDAVHAFRWSGTGAAVDLGADGGVASEAIGVSAAGDVAATVTDADGDRRAVVFRAAGTVAAIGTLGGDESWVVAMSAAGVVLGESHDADGEVRAFTWTEDDGLVDVGPAGGGTAAIALSESGLALGVTTTGGLSTGFVASAAGLVVGIEAIGAGQAPLAINDQGHVIGNFTTVNGSRAFFWAERRGGEDLGSLGGATAEATALNAHGQVVGQADTGAGLGHAFISAAPTTACIVCEEDVEAPNLVCPLGRKPLECTFGGTAATVGIPSVWDACGQPVTVTHDAPVTFDLGATDVTFTAVDSAGNEASCVSTVRVVDSAAPVISCAETLTVDAADGVCGALVTFPTTAVDACDGFDVAMVGPAGPLTEPFFLPPGDTSVTVGAVDRAGNSSTCTTVVTVTGIDPMTIDCDPEVTVDAPADFCGHPEALTADVLDVCTQDLTVQSASDSFPIGVTDVLFEATNARGDEASCTTKLTVRDVTPPAVDCNVPPVPLAPPAAFTPLVSDACGATFVIEDAACLQVTEGGQTVLTEGCDLVVRDGVTVGVNEVPIWNADGALIPPSQLYVVWTVVARDANGNTSEVGCRTLLDLSGRDRDDDGVIDPGDNCPDDANSDQSDVDLDGTGDVCDPAPVEGLIAEGSGGCGAGGAGAGVALVLAALALVALRRRRAA